MSNPRTWTFIVGRGESAVEYDLPITRQSPDKDRIIEVLSVKGGIRAAREMRFRETIRHDSPTWAVGTWVKLRYTDWDSNEWIPFAGKILKRTQAASADEEIVEYIAYDPLALLNRVWWLKDGSYRVCWNMTNADDEDYDLTRKDKDIGYILSEYWDDMTAPLEGSILQTKTGIYNWTFEDTNFPIMTIPNVSFNAPSGGLDIYDSMLKWAPGFCRYVVPDGFTTDQHELRIKEISTLPARNITIGCGEGGWVITNDVTSDITGRFSAVNISGRREQSDVLLFWDPDDPDSTMYHDWDPVSEAAWTPTNWQDDPGRSKVYRCFKPPVNPLNPAYSYVWAASNVRATPNTMIKAWVKHYIYINGTASPVWDKVGCNYDPVNRTIELSSPAYVRGSSPGTYEASPVYLRLVVLGDAVSSRYPESGYSGELYDDYGIEEEWTKYEDRLAKCTFYGKTTDSSIAGIFHDRFMGLRPHQLVGCKLTYNSIEYTITDQTGYSVTVDDEDLVIGEGDEFTIECFDTSADFDMIAQAIHPGLTASPKPITLTKDGVEDAVCWLSQDPVLINLKAADGHTTGWENLRNVLTDWTLDFLSDRVTLQSDSVASMAAKSYEDILSQIDIKDRLEETEIWINRHGTEASTDKDGDSGSGQEGVFDHQHSGTGDGGYLYTGAMKPTLFDDGTHHKQLWMEYDDDEQKFMAALHRHWHSGSGDETDDDIFDGGRLKVTTNQTEFSNGTQEGPLGIQWDADESKWFSTWKDPTP